jgi:hypothetical protein
MTRGCHGGGQHHHGGGPCQHGMRAQNAHVACKRLSCDRSGPTMGHVHLSKKLCFVTHWLPCCAPWLFRRPREKLVRPGPTFELLFWVVALLGFMLEFFFHIYDHFLVFISFESVVEFFFTSPFFCIISTWSPTYICNFSILVAGTTSSIEFQSVLTHLGMWEKKLKKSLTLFILSSAWSKILKISPWLWFNVKYNILQLKVEFCFFLFFWF